MRIGHGYDVHRLVEGRPLILGGVHIPYEKGLLGHSDADVLIHAVMDALLGALALGDIGLHFPDTDTRWMNADSRKLLSQVVSLLNKHNYQVVNLDATLICQTPKLRPFIDVMRTNLASDLATDISNLSVKATTEEGLGISGAGGIAAHCVVLLEERKP
jgi:2-C-methyl-D-erythritol 2,4-cyclodiphosphate synthase